jgi:hypothetical protein
MFLILLNSTVSSRRFQDYEEAQLWLLEDEYEPIEGRLSSEECA